jgi:mannan endo-1,4-beta-mannosidase
MIRGVLITAFAAFATLVAAQTTTLQAESATLSGVTVATAVPGFTGEPFVATKNNKMTELA